MSTGTRRVVTLFVSGLLAVVLLAFVQYVNSAPPAVEINSLDEDFPEVPVARSGGDLSAQVVYPAPYVPVPSTPITLPEQVWRIGIITDGLYSLSYEALALAGLPVAGTSPSDFHLTWRNQNVSLDGTGLGDGTFDAGDSLIFFGEAFHGTVQEEKYTGENVYWLSIDDSVAGSLMSSREVSPTAPFTATGICTVTDGINENRFYYARWTNTPGTDTTWFWNSIPASASTVVTTTATATYKSKTSLSLNLQNLATDPQAQIEVEMASKGTTQHAFLLTLNGAVLGEWTWYGKAAQVVTATLPSGLLVEGVNTVHVYLGELDVAGSMYLDRVEVTYLQQPTAVDGEWICDTPSTGTQDFTVTGLAASSVLYDVTDTVNPVKLTAFTEDGLGLHFTDDVATDQRYIAAPVHPLTAASITAYTPANELVDPATGADEIIIAPALFHAALQPLIAHRESQGLRVALVDVDDLYPLFNGGIYHPEAIRSFVAWAYNYWPGPAPAYIFLVGDGNFNMRGYNPASYGNPVPTYIPPYLFFDDPTQGEVPVDARYGDVIEDANGLPEVSVGHLTANTVTEVVKYVEKVLNYEKQPRDFSHWHNEILLPADDGASYIENFDWYLTMLAQNNIPPVVESTRIYMRDLCDGPSYTPCVTATEALVNEWNSGALMVLYSGHGAVSTWASEPLMRNTDFVSLTQKDMLPLLISLDCWDGYWMFPPEYPRKTGQNLNSIGEWVTVILTETGAIGAFGPAGLGYSNEEYQLTAGVLDSYFEDGVRRLGDLADAGRMPISRTYMARTYTLLGDPAAVLASFTPTRVYLPMALK